MKRTIIAIVSSIFAASVVAGVSLMDLSSETSTMAQAEIIFPQGKEIQKEYSLGDSLDMPDPSTVILKDGAESVEATKSLITFPDGVVKAGGIYDLTQAGNYEVVYYAATGESVSYPFTVYKNNHYVPSTSTAEWVENLSLVSGKSGINLELKEDDSFSFNKKIDLDDFEGETLEICRIYPDIRENATEMPKVSHVTVKVVDCYDPTKFVEIYAWKDSSEGYVYCGAGASSQELSSLEKSDEKANLDYEGQRWYYRTSERYQAAAAYGNWIRASVTEDIADYGGIGFMWDLRTQKVFANQKTFGDFFITDLDAPEIYGENILDVKEFFTTGEVYLNIQCYNYNAASINIQVESIFGESGEDLKDARIVDTVAPTVQLNAEKTNELGVTIAKDEPYVIPMDVTVQDFNYYGDIDIAVYRDYATPSQTTCFVKNGVFTPTEEGWYTVVYTAEDGYGNQGVQTLHIKSVAKESIAYEQIKLDGLEIVRNNAIPYIQATGLNKQVKTSVSVIAPDGTKETLEYSDADQCYYYLPERIGEYEIVYTFSDNVYQREFSYKVHTIGEGNVLFKDTPKLPLYFIKNASYMLSDYYAYTSTASGLEAHLTEMEISVDNGAYKKLSKAECESYKMEASDSVKFKFSYGGESMETQAYPVLDLKFGEKSYSKNKEGVETYRPYAEYWQGNYNSYDYTGNSIDYTFAQGTEDASMTFVNLISLAKFKFDYSLSGKFGAMRIVLADCGSPEDNKVEIMEITTLKGVKYVASVYENGELVETVSNEQFKANYYVYYSAGKIYYGEKSYVMAPKFTTDLSLLSIEFEDIQENAVFSLKQINNQPFRMPSKMVEAGPECSYTYLNGSVDYGSDYIVNAATAYSVLSPTTNKNLTVSVTDANGDYLTAKDGTVMNEVKATDSYVLHLSNCGQYKVTYNVSVMGSDLRGGKEFKAINQYYIINVTDYQPPKIAFVDGTNENSVVEISVGTIHKLKAVSVSDNVTAQANLTVYKMVLNENYMLVSGGFGADEYAFVEAGNYIVQYWVFDKDGNCSKCEYKIQVR